MSKTSKQDATGSALGYYYQGIYAIPLLLQQSDDAIISIETGDDIEQVEPGKHQLFQLKHASGLPPPLSLSNDGFWNTVSIWINKLADTDITFVYVTCASLAPQTPLGGLTDAKTPSISDVVAALTDEATRVVAAAAAAKHAGKPTAYSKRLPGCEAYLNLTPAQRENLVSRITILANSPTLQDVEPRLTQKLDLYPRHLRPMIARRLLEWGSYRIALSLTNAAPREISKIELLNKVNDVALALSDDTLPDDFSSVIPASVASELGTPMQKQIEIVNGGNSRVQRAAVARWRARSQRQRWLDERVGFADELRLFDERLVEAWRDRHAPMCDDCSTEPDHKKAQHGLALLDWSHFEAANGVPRLRPKWDRDFVVQGSYQELADQLKVGWHPDYMTMLAKTQDGAGS